MKKIITKSLIVTGVVFIFFNVAVFADNNASNEINIITARLFERINDSRFDDAAKLFHCPTNMSRSECGNERKALSHMLSVMQREFGKLDNIMPLQKRYTFYSVSAGSGDMSYWQLHPDVLQKNYEVKFNKEGEGYVVIQSCNISGRWEIRSVSFALPAERPDAMARIREILKITMNEMKPFMNEGKDIKESI
jgi:hypothetical protein